MPAWSWLCLSALDKQTTEFVPGDLAPPTFPLASKAIRMGLEFLTMSVFWTWYSLQPASQSLPEAQVVPTKQIIQATWIEPVSLRDETSPPALRKPAEIKKSTRCTSKPVVKAQKTKTPLWKAQKSWEFPPILWAGFEAFLAAGLGIVGLIKP